MKRFLLSLVLVFSLVVPAGAGWYIDDGADLFIRTKPFQYRDLYSNALSAGSVDGTACEPGPGTREIVDAGSQVSISGGALVIGGAAASWSGIDESVTRSLGKSYRNTITVADVTKTVEFGFDTNKTGAIGAEGFRITADTVKPICNGTAGPTVRVPTDGTQYSFLVSERSAGAFFATKEGATGQWLLDWVCNTGAASTLYAGLYNTDATVSALDEQKVPRTAIAFKPFTSDSFTRSDGAAGSTDGLGHLEADGSGSGQAWSAGTISSNSLVITPTEGASLWDAAASTMEAAGGTYAWAAYGTNTIANDGDALKITYVDSSNGAINYFSDAADLSSNLTVGNWYIFSCDAKVNAGSSVVLWVNSALSDGRSVTQTDFTNFDIPFRVSHATNNHVYVYGMGAGEIIWLDNFSLKQLTLSSLFSCSTTPFSTADVISTVTIPTFMTGTQAGIVVNLDSLTTPTALVIAYLDGAGNAKVDELAGGVWTNKISGAVTYGAAKELRVVRDGTYCALYYDNALVGSVSTMTANTNKYHGLFSTYSGNKFDNFTVYGRGTNGEYTRLNWF